MTTTQRVDVARFDPCISRERSDARHVYPTPDMEHAAFGEYVKYEDYAALLQQLAELERDNETMRGADYHQAGVEQEQEIIDLESKLAERDAEVDRLKGVIAWVGQVYPATDAEADGAHMTVTWAQFNAMREAAGFQPAKAATKARNKSLIVRADYLRSLEAAFLAANVPTHSAGGE